jgi:hypothetical protein
MQQQQIPIRPAVSISLIFADWRKSYSGHNFFHLLHLFFSSSVSCGYWKSWLVMPHQQVSMCTSSCVKVFVLSPTTNEFCFFVLQSVFHSLCTSVHSVIWSVKIYVKFVTKNTRQYFLVPQFAIDFGQWVEILCLPIEPTVVCTETS